MAGALLLQACAWTPPWSSPAPPPAEVAVFSAPPVVAGPSAEQPASTEPAAQDARPVSYTVRRGDTLMRIGIDMGYNWRDIARLNQLEPPYRLPLGKVLRLREATETASGVPAPALATAGADTAAAAAATPGPPAPPDAGRFQWPTAGRQLIERFDENGKGIDIGGALGDRVLAAEDGRVVYAGSALPGYGNIVILKHTDGFLTAYGHNQRLLVKDQQIAKRGQQIATMGRSGAKQVKLRFEIRLEGKPLDPMAWLPKDGPSP